MIGGMGILLFRGGGEKSDHVFECRARRGACVFSEEGNVYVIDGGSTDRGKWNVYLGSFFKI